MPKKTVIKMRPIYESPLAELFANLRDAMTETEEVEMTLRETVQYYLTEWLYSFGYWIVFWIVLFFAAFISGIRGAFKDATRLADNKRFDE